MTNRTNLATKQPPPAVVQTDTLVRFQQAENQIETYYDRWHKNLDVVAKAANLAYLNVQEIIQIKDREESSWAWVVFDLALQVALPGVFQISKTYAKLTQHYATQAAKKTGADPDTILEDLKSDVRFLTEVVHRGGARVTSRADGYEKPSVPAPVTTQLETLKQIVTQLVETQGGIQKTKENMKRALTNLLATQGNNLFVENAELLATVSRPPPLLNERFADVVYALEWLIMERFVRRKLWLEIRVDLDEPNKVVEYAPSPLSNAACKAIFRNFTRTLELKFLVTDPEAPASRSVYRPVTSWENFVNVWICDVEIVPIPNRAIEYWHIHDVNRRFIKHRPPLKTHLGALHPALAARAAQTKQVHG
jgi:hypothetical protein